MRRVLAFLVAVLLLSGCEMRAELVVNDDGSGTMTYVLGIDKAQLAKATSDPFAPLRANAAKATFPVRLSDYETEKLKGLRASFDFEDMADLERKQKTWSDRSFVFDDLTVTRKGSLWRLAATAGDPVAASGLPIDTTQLQQALDVRFVATLPGSSRGHNATSAVAKDGKTTYEWRIAAGKGDLSLRAETSDPRFPWVPVAAGALVVAVAAGALLWWRLRRRRAVPAETLDESVLPESAPSEV